MCHSNNTTRILFEHISFEWDYLKVKFAQQKNDTRGFTQKYPRHIFANAFNPAVCPFLALAMYIATFGVSFPWKKAVRSIYEISGEHLEKTRR